MNLKNNKRLTRISDLTEAGLLPDGADITAFEELAQHYDIGLTPHITEQMLRENAAQSPLSRQYIPSLQELEIQSDEEHDPIGDQVYSPVSGVVHRYPDRVLLKISNICAVYCRYCFRREMIGKNSDHLSADDLNAAIDYISSNPQIWEVILTGGDPLILSARRLQHVIDALNRIEHVQIIRIHSRIPVAAPDMINEEILSVLKSSTKAVHMVIHINHADEISDSMRSALSDLRMANCSLYAQSVLLKGVNDNAQTLENLFRALVTLHVKPYYLHHPDRAKGTSHFRVSIAEGQKIMQALQGRLSGIALPKYMLDIPGGHGKVPIHGNYITALDDDHYHVQDYQGCTHLYIDKQ